MKSILAPIRIVSVLIVSAVLIAWTSGCSEQPATSAELWCAEHGIPEAQCTLCHPELKEKLLWCAEHDCPEGVCTLCHPELKKKIKVCEHGLPAVYCKTCSPEGT